MNGIGKLVENIKGPVCENCNGISKYKHIKAEFKYQGGDAEDFGFNNCRLEVENYLVYNWLGSYPQ